MASINKQLLLPIPRIYARICPVQASRLISGSCIQWLRPRTFSIGSNNNSTHPRNALDEEIVDDGVASASSLGALTASSSSRRSPTLAAVIREGLPFLNQSASYIQESKHTRKPLYSLQDRGRPSMIQEAEEYRLYSVASECLDDICRKDQENALTIHGEPIVLLQVQVHPSFQHATIYWALPLTLLMDDGLTDSQIHRLTVLLQEELMTPHTKAAQALAQLHRKLVSRLFASYKRTPKIRWEPATPEMVYAFQQYHYEQFDNVNYLQEDQEEKDKDDSKKS